MIFNMAQVKRSWLIRLVERTVRTGKRHLITLWSQRLGKRAIASRKLYFRALTTHMLRDINAHDCFHAQREQDIYEQVKTRGHGSRFL